MPFNNKIEYEEPAVHPGTPVSVIASFRKDGGLKPLYFKYDTPQYTETVKIEDVKSLKHFPLSCSDFSCSVMVGDRQNTVVLRYMKREERWFLLPSS